MTTPGGASPGGAPAATAPGPGAVPPGGPGRSAPAERAPRRAAAGAAGIGDRALAALTAALTLPILWMGYGTDIDVPDVLRAGESIRRGDYVPSRPPGVPVFEAVVAALDPIGGHLLINLATAVAGGATGLGIARLVRGWGPAHGDPLAVGFPLAAGAAGRRRRRRARAGGGAAPVGGRPAAAAGRRCLRRERRPLLRAALEVQPPAARAVGVAAVAGRDPAQPAAVPVGPGGGGGRQRGGGLPAPRPDEPEVARAGRWDPALVPGLLVNDIGCRLDAMHHDPPPYNRVAWPCTLKPMRGAHDDPADGDRG